MKPVLSLLVLIFATQSLFAQPARLDQVKFYFDGRAYEMSDRVAPTFWTKLAGQITSEEKEIVFYETSEADVLELVMGFEGGFFDLDHLGGVSEFTRRYSAMGDGILRLELRPKQGGFMGDSVVFESPEAFDPGLASYIDVRLYPKEARLVIRMTSYVPEESGYDERWLIGQLAQMQIEEIVE